LRKRGQNNMCKDKDKGTDAMKQMQILVNFLLVPFKTICWCC